MIPTNEQGVVALFSKLSHEMGYEFKRIGTHCPDAILEKDGREVRVEFEYRASSFRAHKHDPAAVDLIICWEDDWPESSLPVLSLQMYLTLVKHEAPRQPMWRRLVAWWHEASTTWHSLAAERLQQRRCSHCGGPTKVRFEISEVGTWHYHDGNVADIEHHGTMFYTCQNCGYIRTRQTSYLTGPVWNEPLEVAHES